MHLNVRVTEFQTQKNTLGVYISVREIYVSTRPGALIGSLAAEKTPRTPQRKKDWETWK